MKREEDFVLAFQKYADNNRTYIWLYLPDGEPYIDITENHPEIEDERLIEKDEEGNVIGERVIINHDFVDMCGWVREAKIILMEKIPNCLGGWDIDWLPALYLIKK